MSRKITLSLFGTLVMLSGIYSSEAAEGSTKLKCNFEKSGDERLIVFDPTKSVAETTNEFGTFQTISMTMTPSIATFVTKYIPGKTGMATETITVDRKSLKATAGISIEGSQFVLNLGLGTCVVDKIDMSENKF